MGDREKCVRAGLLSLGVAALGWTFTAQHQISAAGQTADAPDQARRDVHAPRRLADEEAPAPDARASEPTEAPAAFDNLTNGFTTQADVRRDERRSRRSRRSRTVSDRPTTRRAAASVIRTS